MFRLNGHRLVVHSKDEVVEMSLEMPSSLGVPSIHTHPSLGFSTTSLLFSHVPLFRSSAHISPFHIGLSFPLSVFAPHALFPLSSKRKLEPGLTRMTF